MEVKGRSSHFNQAYPRCESTENIAFQGFDTMLLLLWSTVVWMNKIIESVNPKNILCCQVRRLSPKSGVTFECDFFRRLQRRKEVRDCHGVSRCWRSPTLIISKPSRKLGSLALGLFIWSSQSHIMPSSLDTVRTEIYGTHTQSIHKTEKHLEWHIHFYRRINHWCSWIPFQWIIATELFKCCP